jgi:agmatine deiminase
MDASLRKKRLPAEWEKQEGVLLAWPHEKTDWQPHLQSVERVYGEISSHISRCERLTVVTPDPEDVRDKIRRSGADLERLRIFGIETNDTWTRDFGPITVMENGKRTLLDFRFNGWGLKFPADLDNRVTRRLWESGAWGDTPIRTVDLVLEGGSIESNGRGTILTTAQCLLNPNRNAHLSRDGIEALLGGLLGADRFLWLESGHLEGDDTDSHVDTLARFAPGDTILYTACDDPEDTHYESLLAMADELKRFTTRAGKPYRLVPLPWPPPCRDEAGERIPATYANFLVLNGAVLVPAHGNDRDAAAMSVIGKAFPGRRIVGINCLPLLLQHGSLHCATMQIPEGIEP